MGIHAKAKKSGAIKVLAFACLVASDPVEAVDKTWNTTTGNWDTGTNWTPVNEPAAADRVFINNGGTAEVSTGGNVSQALTLGSAFGNTGTLSIFGGGQLTSGAASNLGLAAGATGTAIIDGAGSFWRINNALTVGSTGNGTINITNGGLLHTATGAVVTLGSASGSLGGVTVDGIGSTFLGNSPTNNTVLRIGGIGTGTLTVSNGGTVSNFGSISLAVFAGGTGNMTIAGAGSSVSTGSVTIGSAGQGTLSILNGGVLNGGAAVVGSATISGLAPSTATIDGGGSKWAANGGLSVGTASNGNVFVRNGGVLESAGGAIGGSTGVGLVELDNGTWDAMNATGQAVITVGGGGTGTLRLLNGSTAQTSNRLIVGSGANSNGTMVIDNSGFTLLPQSAGVQANTTEIGRDIGTGSLTVRNGSTVVLNSTLQLGTRMTTGDGTLIVQDAGTTLTATGGFSVGQNGTGHFRLLSNAVMNTGNFLSAGSVSGDSVIDNATLNVNGNGLTAVGRLGVRGTATLDIQNGGVVNMAAGAINDLEIAQEAGSVGTLTIGGTGGTLNVDQVIGGKQDFGNGGVIVQGGAATVNFNHTNVGQAFTPRLRGFMTVNQMNTGTSILGGDGDYFGQTNVSGGILRAGITNAFSENSDYVVTTGNLELNNLDNEIGSLAGNGNVILGTGTLTTGSTLSTSWSGDISGTGGLIKTGATVFSLDSVQSYTGLTTVREGTLQARIANAIAASSGLTVNSGAIFNMGMFDQLIGGDVINNGLISFGSIGKELTVNGNLSGNGMFFMETDVAAGFGDHITVTGTSAGSHFLRILNTGNTPSQTQILEVVDTTDGAAPFAAVGGTVDVGLYAYKVMRGDELGLDPTNWYLGNTQKSSEGARAILNTAAGLSNMWFTQMDNLHRRMGQQRLVDPGARGHDIWVRGYSRKIKVDDSVSGRPFDENISGIDVGIDTVVSTNEVNTVLVGAFAGYGWSDRDFNDFGSSGKSRTPYVGLYGTWFDKRGLYVDATFKVQYFNNEFDALDGSGNHHRGDYNRLGIGGGVEVGKRFYFNDGWSLQPQAQFHYVYLDSDEHTTDRNTHVKIEGNSVWQIRAGIEGGKEIADGSGGIWYPYGRISLIEQYSKGNKLTADNLSFTPKLEGTNLEYGVGLIYQADKRRQGYFALTTGSGQHYDTPWAINVGLRYEF
jgi:outer membrane autotransporter protein